MKSENKIKRKLSWAIIIGLGFALSPIHNAWLTQLATVNGQVNFFIPTFGTFLWLWCSLAFLVWNWNSIDWGNRKILVALSIIAVSIGISGLINEDSFQDRISPLFMGISLLAVYLTCRTLGNVVFYAIIPFVILNVIIVAAIGLLNPGLSQGGLISNNCASAGYIIFGTVVSRGKWQWLLCALAFVGLFYIGELEPVFMMFVICSYVLYRAWREGEYSYKMPLSLLPVTIAIIAWALLGYLSILYWGNGNVTELARVATGNEPLNTATVDAVTSDRFTVYLDTLRNMKLLGHGYSLSTTAGGIAHNMFLVIVQQVGILAAIAWLGVTVYCLIKTKWKYAWLCVIAMSVFDHYLWTQMTPLWWALAGVSLTSTIENDHIFSSQKKCESILIK